jgi:hypothetical protein
MSENGRLIFHFFALTVLGVNKESSLDEVEREKRELRGIIYQID